MDTNDAYQKLSDLYKEKFSLKYLGNSINNKFALISLICYVTKKLQEKNPNATHLAVLKKINEENIIPNDFLEVLAIVCEDFAYGCDDFPTFNIKSSEMIKTIKDLLKNFIPF